MKKDLAYAMAKALHDGAVNDWKAFYNVDTLALYSEYKAQKVKSGRFPLNHYRGFLRGKWRKHFPAKRWEECIKEIKKPSPAPSMIYLQFGYSKTAVRCKATIYNGFRYERFESGYIGGYGYDRVSTAAAVALNQCEQLRQWMLGLLLNDKNFDFGYGVATETPLPSFMNGVGIDTTVNCFRRMGYTPRYIYSPWSYELQTVVLVKC